MHHSIQFTKALCYLNLNKGNLTISLYLKTSHSNHLKTAGKSKNLKYASIYHQHTKSCIPPMHCLLTPPIPFSPSSAQPNTLYTTWKFFTTRKVSIYLLFLCFITLNRTSSAPNTQPHPFLPARGIIQVGVNSHVRTRSFYDRF